METDKSLERQDEIDACRHGRLDLAAWDEGKAQWPREWAKVLAKRKRRLDWFLAHGSVPDGWTPPDPADPRRTANRPIAAYLARRKLTLDEFYAKYSSVPLVRVRRHPNWRLIHRVTAWTTR